jgi:integrase
MSVYRPKGSRTLWVRYRGPVDERHPRGEYRVNAKTNDEKKAAAFLKDELRKVANHAVGESAYVEPKRTRATIAELLDEKLRHDEALGRKGLRPLKHHVAHVKELLGHVRANELRPAAITRYIETRRKQAAAAETTVADATLDRELETLRPAYALAEIEHLCPKIQRLVKVGTNARQGFVEPWEHEAIIAAMPSDVLRDVCRWAWLTGSRRNEILSLVWRNYSAADGMMRLDAANTKTGRSRKYPVEGELLAIIKRRLAARVSTSADELVFHVRGRRIGDFWNTFDRACIAAKVQGRTFHDYRRSAIRQMSQAGVPRHLIMAFSGHTTDSVFNRYSIGSETELRAALAAREAMDAKALKQYADGKVLNFERK